MTVHKQEEKTCILAIETSCDETAIAVVRGSGGLEHPNFEIAANIVLSQIALHARYGGVFPMMAKREHAKNLVPALKEALAVAGMAIASEAVGALPETNLRELLRREETLADALVPYLASIARPKIDMIAVTAGPGLEPTLWTGINFAKALSRAWNIPLIPVNHMEGHLFSALLSPASDGRVRDIAPFRFPLLALLVSGGHTELILARNWFVYERIGETRDDAAGEAFDKVARMLSLPYPGGPEIARLAAARSAADDAARLGIKLPRPMLDSDDFDFSFSGLKTAALYLVKKLGELDGARRRAVAYEFENAAVDVLVAKTIAAAECYGARAVALGGGVSANGRLRETLTRTLNQKLPGTECRLSPSDISGDNALMVAVATYLRSVAGVTPPPQEIVADGNLRLV